MSRPLWAVRFWRGGAAGGGGNGGQLGTFSPLQKSKIPSQGHLTNKKSRSKTCPKRINPLVHPAKSKPRSVPRAKKRQFKNLSGDLLQGGEWGGGQHKSQGKNQGPTKGGPCLWMGSKRTRLHGSQKDPRNQGGTPLPDNRTKPYQKDWGTVFQLQGASWRKKHPAEKRAKFRERKTGKTTEGLENRSPRTTN